MVGLAGSPYFMVSVRDSDRRARLLCDALEMPHDEMCVASLRKVPLTKLVGAMMACMRTAGISAPQRPMLPFYPVAAGKLYPNGSALKSLLAGCGRQIPLLIGTCRWESYANEGSNLAWIEEDLKKRVAVTAADEWTPPPAGWSPAAVGPVYMKQARPTCARMQWHTYTYFC